MAYLPPTESARPDSRPTRVPESRTRRRSPTSSCAVSTAEAKGQGTESIAGIPDVADPFIRLIRALIRFRAGISVDDKYAIY